jgi:anti-sigma-K factor RskA
MTIPTHDPNPIDLAAGYVLDDLSPEEADQLKQTLTENPAFYQEIAALGEAFALLPYSASLQSPSPHLKAKILSAAQASVAADRAAPQSNIIPMPRRNWQRWLPIVSTGIAAMAVAALGLNQMQMQRQSQQAIAARQQLENEVAQLQNELKAKQQTIAAIMQPDIQTYDLTGATSAVTSSRAAKARLSAKPGDRAVTLVAQSLPKLDQAQVYRLWAVAAPKSAPIYCGQFRQDDSGTAQWDAPNVACTNKPVQLIITLDQPSDPITAAGPMVMQSES